MKPRHRALTRRELRRIVRRVTDHATRPQTPIEHELVRLTLGARGPSRPELRVDGLRGAAARWAALVDLRVLEVLGLELQPWQRAVLEHYAAAVTHPTPKIPDGGSQV